MNLTSELTLITRRLGVLAPSPTASGALLRLGSERSGANGPVVNGSTDDEKRVMAGMGPVSGRLGR